MKNIYIMLIAAALCAMSCTDEKDVYRYLDVETLSYTFDADGESEFTVGIQSDPADWDIKLLAEWVELVARTEKSITLRAEPNQTGIYRSGSVEITAGNLKNSIQLGQIAIQTGEAGFRMIPELWGVSSYVISNNGRYFAGCRYEMVDNGDWTYSYLYTPVVVDLETDEVTVYETVDDRIFSITAIADDGVTMLVSETFKSASIFRNNQFDELPFPDGFASNDTYVDGFTPDGRIIYGYGRLADGSDWMYRPIKWIDGTPQVMPYPENDAHGDPVDYGFRVLGSSADGTLMYGSEYGTNSGILWNNDTGETTYIGNDRYFFVEGWIDLSQWGYGEVWSTLHNQCEMRFTDYNRMSPNGRYIVSRYYDADIINKWYFDFYRPAITDTETGETEIYFDLENLMPLTVSDDGIIFMIEEEPRDGESLEHQKAGMVYDPRRGELTTCREWVMNRYGIITPDIQIIKITAGGNILALTYISDNGPYRAVPCVIIPG